MHAAGHVLAIAGLIVLFVFLGPLSVFFSGLIAFIMLGSAWERMHLYRIGRQFRRARRARWRLRRGVRGMIGRRSWRRLLRILGRGNWPYWKGVAISRREDLPHYGRDWLLDLVWPMWLAAPDDQGWAALYRFGRGGALARMLSAAVSDAGRTNDVFVGFCIRHGLAPEDPVERARFFVLTGQQVQRRALDPDGTLLAAAYQASGDDCRDALRQALAFQGDLDAVRTVAASTSLTGSERWYLEQHAAHRDWAALWRLAKDLPLLEAAHAVSLIEPSWRPHTQRDRDLFTLFTAVSPVDLRRAWESLRTDCVIGIKVPGRVVAGALSGDGRRIAVVAKAGRSAVISVYELPAGQPVTRHTIAMRDHIELAYAEDGTLIAVSSALVADGTGDSEVYRCPDTGPLEVAAHADDVIVAIIVCRGGLAAVHASGRLEFHSSDGSALGTGIDLEGPVAFGEDVPVPVASDVATGQLAVVYRSAVLGEWSQYWSKFVLVEAVQPGDARVVARNTFVPLVTAACFAGGGRVIVARGDGICVERLGPEQESIVAASSYGTWYQQGPRRMIAVSGRPEICALDRSGAVHYLHARTRHPVDVSGELTGKHGNVLWTSAAGGHALGGDGVVYVVTPELLAVRPVADRPQVAWQRADLTIAAAAAPVVTRSPAALPLQDLLVGCLEHRFGMDVALGDATSGEDDIALSDSPGHPDPATLTRPP